ncbi:MAG: O-acetylhomoserine aminocarboxypropyltransferase/cysteine synthase [Oscillospiraceae bacterium]|jgi:O-acetylhomoserine (thiol)-lyase|nr:O-acetylhomoserine aminocarboxypropyltransferase/cysteine synthase [Oscillospiraceae bacterium]
MTDYGECGFETKMVHAGYDGDASHAVVPPLYQTNAYYYDDTAHAQRLFGLKEAGNIYTRITNPTNAFLEARVNALEGGVGALAFSSGHAAMFGAIANLACSGDEIVSSRDIYGGAVNMFGVSLKRLGITVKFVDPDDLRAWEAAVTPRTRLFFTELIGNPNANISDIEKIAETAHAHGIPFMVDGTFNTPYLCRPLEWGADFTVHSATKFLSGHGQVMAGIVTDGGSFEFKGNPRFPLFNQPDVSYHGMVFADAGRGAFILRLRALILRDFGACAAPFNSFAVLQGIETLSLRMERHCDNALKIAEYLESRSDVLSVGYPSLKSGKYRALADKYMPRGAGGVFSFRLKGGKEKAVAFMDGLRLIQNVSNVGDIRTQVVHSATTTHSQLSEEQLRLSGIDGGDVRISVGIETADDLIRDIERALDGRRAKTG